MPALRRHRLTEVPSGSDCTISRVQTHDFDKLRYIAKLGLVPGEAFHLFSCAPFKGPLRLKAGRHDHVIGYELAKSFRVEVAAYGTGNKTKP